MKHICIIGLGGVGGFYANKLAGASLPDTTISFVARGATYNAVQQRGLTLRSDDNAQTVHPHYLADDVRALPPADLYLICTKAYGLDAVCSQLKGHISPNSIILPILNGVDIVERVRKTLPDAVILPSCVYIVSHIQDPGVIHHTGNLARLFWGSDPLHPQVSTDFVAKHFDAAGLDHIYRENPYTEIWTKFLFIASFGMTTARYDATMGQVIESMPFRETARGIMNEIAAIAAQRGIPLASDAIENAFNLAGKIPYDSPTSLLLDIRARRPGNELDLFGGTILRYGREAGIPTPITQGVVNDIATIK